jgi:hypothetical protein
MRAAAQTEQRDPNCIYNVNVKFDWDAANTDHIARHGITPMEAEQGCS